jgi:predicted RNA polymerase sigma factor
LRQLPEPYRTTLILRDLEEMSYEEIAEVLQISLGTVKSRLTRGRQALKERLASYVRETAEELGLVAPDVNTIEITKDEDTKTRSRDATGCCGGRNFEVMA